MSEFLNLVYMRKMIEPSLTMAQARAAVIAEMASVPRPALPAAITHRVRVVVTPEVRDPRTQAIVTPEVFIEGTVEGNMIRKADNSLVPHPHLI